MMLRLKLVKFDLALLGRDNNLVRERQLPSTRDTNTYVGRGSLAFHHRSSDFEINSFGGRGRTENRQTRYNVEHPFGQQLGLPT